jgi:hypothetical protein
MRVQIKKLPATGFLEGFDLRRFEVGQSYDVGPRLGELLVVMDYAEPDRRFELRRPDRANDRGS